MTHPETQRSASVAKAIGPDFETAGPADLVARGRAAWPAIGKARADIIAGTLTIPFNAGL